MSESDATYTIGQLAEKSGLTRRALRLYERAGLLVPLRAENNYRHYTNHHLKIASVIRELRQAGLSVQVIKQVVDIKRTDRSMQEKLAACIGVLDEAEAELKARRESIDTALNQLQSFKIQAQSMVNQLTDYEEESA